MVAVTLGMEKRLAGVQPSPTVPTINRRRQAVNERFQIGNATVPVACSRRLAGYSECSGVFGETPKTAGEDAQCH
jgi:hypothetical protein